MKEEEVEGLPPEYVAMLERLSELSTVAFLNTAVALSGVVPSVPQQRFFTVGAILTLSRLVATGAADPSLTRADLERDAETFGVGVAQKLFPNPAVTKMN